MEKTVTTEKYDVSSFKKQNQLKQIFHRLLKNKGAVVGMIIVVLLILAALCAPLMFDYNTDIIGLNMAERLQGPSAEHWFGTDEMGRDLFARIIWGSRASLSIGFASVAIGFVIGGFLGAIAGFYGGRVDNIIMRSMDVIMAIPTSLLAITIVAGLGISVQNLIIAISISSVPGSARIVRGSVMTVRHSEFVEAATAVGARAGRVIFGHVVPNSLAPVIVHLTLKVAGCILLVSGLSFVGLGISAPIPEWGSLLSSGRTYIRESSYMTLFPGLAIMVTILALNLFGDGLRDALDPRLK